MRSQLGRAGLFAMRWGLVGCLLLAMAFFLRDAMSGRHGTAAPVGPDVRSAPSPAPGAPTPAPAAEDPTERADRFYRFISTEGLVAAGAKGLVACADRRVVPLLVAVCDRHDPSLVAEGLTPLWAARSLNTLLKAERTPEAWTGWFDENRASYADCRFLHRYQVRAGDTLWRISRRVYGSPDGMARLRERNRAVIPKADSLKPGLILTVPH